MIKRTFKQADMTPECWAVQFEGFDACIGCEFLDTDECGGQEIIRTGKNAKGHEVPLGRG